MSRFINYLLFRCQWCSMLVVASVIGLLATERFCRADDTIAREPILQSWQHDAELTDIQFVDQNVGWAVGESGTLLHTRDGGLTWKQNTGRTGFRSDSVQLQQKVADLQNGRATRSTGVAGRQAQVSPFTCRLESVNFVDSGHGWAVGGVKVPYVDRTQAVVLHTRDGGLSWQSMSSLGLPRLRKIQFSDARRGIGIGDSGNVFTGGIFQTNNGGRSWSGSVYPFERDWIDVQSAGPGQQITISATGELGRIKSNRYQAGVLIGLAENTQPRFRNILMLDEKTAVAVGDQGLIFQTKNAGLSWNRIEIEQQDPQAQRIDWYSATLAGKKIKLAGNPGSFIATIDLDSDQIRLDKTPVRSKLNQLFFLNENIGWAVGDHGVILSTDDGGQVWRQQRGNTRGLAMMVVAPTATEIPMDMLARYAMEDNLACGMVVMRDSLGNYESARQASARIGCCSFERFSGQRPTGTAKQIGSVGDTSTEQIIDRLVRSIRIHRPSVVVSQAQKHLGSGAINDYQIVSRSVALAADPNAYPHQLKLGLQTHRVDRLVVRDPVGSISINGKRVLVQVGQQLKSKISLSRALVGRTTSNQSPTHYRVVNFRSQSKSPNGSDLFRGISRQRRVNRLGKATFQGNLAAIRKSNQTAQRLEDFAAFEIIRPSDVSVWRLQLQRFLNTMEVDVHVGSSWTMHLIENYLKQGNATLAVESAEMLVSRFPNSPYAIAVATWLAQHYTSDEFNRIALDRQIRNGALEQDGTVSDAVRRATAYSSAPEVKTAGGVTTLTWKLIQPAVKTTSAQTDPAVAVASHDAAIETIADVGATAIVTPDFVVQRLRRSAQLLSFIGHKDPGFAAGPYCQWLEVQLAERLAKAGAEPISSLPSRYQQLVKKGVSTRPSDGPPASANLVSIEQRVAENAAQALLLLATSEDERNEWSAKANLKIANCPRIDERPVLDGKLNDSQWNQAASLPVAQNLGDESATAALRLYRDRKHLYLAVVCPKVNYLSYDSPTEKTRQRDGILSHVDQIKIEFDTDNDAATSFQFAVDHRGWARESCDWIQGWNPNWYVAHQESEAQWVVEAAIPLATIAVTQIRSGETWAVRASRTSVADAKPDRRDSDDGSSVTQSTFQHRPFGRTEYRIKF